MTQLIKQMVRKSQQQKREQPKKDRNGWYYYDHLPEGCRQATMDDVRNGMFKDKTPYLLFGVVSGRYEFHRVKGEFNQLLIPFIENERVWVFV